MLALNEAGAPFAVQPALPRGVSGKLDFKLRRKFALMTKV